MDNKGYDFLNKIYQNLHLSDEVMHTAIPSDNKNEKIAKYMERLERVTRRAFNDTRATRDNDIAMLKRLYYKKYVITRENIPESYFELQKKIALERGFGHLEYTAEAKKLEIDHIISEQEESLDKWIEYFASPDTDVYPTWYKYYAFQGMLKLGTFDKAKGSFNRRTASTVKPFIELDREALAFVYDVLKKAMLKEQIEDEELEELINNGSFGKLYGYALKKLEEAKKDISSDVGIWKKYKRGSNPEVLYNDIHGKGTGWCTAGGLETATIHINGGDFYVYFTKGSDGEYSQPRVAIRKEGPMIAEIRGIGPDQNLESNMEQIVEEKLQEAEFPDREEYKQKVEDMQVLTFIYEKCQKKEELTTEELRFLYEMDRKIIGFGYQDDPRIKEILETRNMRKDISTILNCDEKQVSTTKEEALSGGIIYHYGDLDLCYVLGDKGLQLPKYIIGSLNLRGTYNAEGLQLPKHIEGSLNLSGLYSAEGLKLPENIEYLNLSGLESAVGLKLPENIRDLNLSGLKNAEGLKLPGNIDRLYLSGLESAEGLKFPESVKYLDLSGLKNAEGLKLPENIGTLNLRSLESAEGLVLPENVKDLSLRGLKRAEGLRFPEYIKDTLYLDHLTSFEGAILPHTNKGRELFLNAIKKAGGYSPKLIISLEQEYKKFPIEDQNQSLAEGSETFKKSK